MSDRAFAVFSAPSETVPVYPTGRGRYAFEQPDGVVLLSGKCVELPLAGARLAATVQHSDLGDYLLLATGERCGLCPGMRVIPSQLDRELIAKRQRQQRLQVAQVEEARKMEVTRFLQFFVTTDPESTTSWIAQARHRYSQMEQALLPLQQVVSELEPDWQPKDPAYWQRMIEHLIRLRQTLEECRSLFEREQSREDMPIPLEVLGSRLRYILSLSSVAHTCDEVGILLTSHSAAPRSHEVASLRQRQEVLKALQAFCDAGRKAIEEGQAGFDALAVEQQRDPVPLAPRKRRKLGGDVLPGQQEGVSNEGIR